MKYRDSLRAIVDGADPNEIYFGGVGNETEAVFNEGFDLPEFALHSLLKDPKGRKFIEDHSEQLVNIVKESGAARGFIQETPTFRSSLTWAEKLGLGRDEFKSILRDAVNISKPLVAKHDSADFKVFLCAFLGPSNDGYSTEKGLTVDEAKELHSFEVDIFESEGVDLVGIVCIAYVEEAIGATLACKEKNVPALVSFTLETDGKLPSGDTLQSAIEAVEAATDRFPLYYQINCAHFDHFTKLFTPENMKEPWVQRIRALRPNASRKSHSELDESSELDSGDPVEFGRLFGQIKKRMPHINFVSGCCGTGARHLECAAVTMKALVEM